MSAKRRYEKNGFTLVELLVSISIIAMVSAIVLANLNYSGRKGRLNMAAEKLASDIRLVQDYALGLRGHNGVYPDGGWGIFMDQDADKYIIFADLNEDGEYNSAGNEFSQEINFPQDIKVQGQYDGIDTLGAPFNNKRYFHIIFEPPDPTTHINALAALNDYTNVLNEYDAQSVEIVLETVDSAYTKILDVNSSGLIDVVN